MTDKSNNVIVRCKFELLEEKKVWQGSVMANNEFLSAENIQEKVQSF